MQCLVKYGLCWCFVVFSQVSGQDGFWDAIPQQRSTTPASYDETRSQLISTRVQQANEVGVFFVGNSITHFWEDKSSWDQYFGDMNPINAGISGDRTQGVLYRFTHGNLEFKPGVHPVFFQQ